MEEMTIFNYVRPDEVESAYKELWFATNTLKSVISTGEKDHVIEAAKVRVQLQQVEVDRIHTLIDMFQTRTYEKDGN